MADDSFVRQVMLARMLPQTAEGMFIQQEQVGQSTEQMLRVETVIQDKEHKHAQTLAVLKQAGMTTTDPAWINTVNRHKSGIKVWEQHLAYLSERAKPKP